MDVLLEFFDLSDLAPAIKNRLVLSAFCLLIAVLLTYFWSISREKVKAANQDGKGLVYLALAFVLYATIGFVGIYQPDAISTLLIISGLISCCFLSALCYFNLRKHGLDRVVSHPAWKNGVKYFAFGWVIVISLAAEHPVTKVIDVVLAVVAIGLLGYFLTRYFIRRQLRFIALITGIYFSFFLVFQMLESGALTGGKFAHINTAFLAPAMVLAVIALAYTFNWINELNFYQLSSIWTGEEDTSATPRDTKTPDLQRGQ
ncbi:MAG: hypothetical protein AAFN92_16130, partial [Bacteroidota bacterium]